MVTSPKTTGLKCTEPKIQRYNWYTTSSLYHYVK